MTSVETGECGFKKQVPKYLSIKTWKFTIKGWGALLF